MALTLGVAVLSAVVLLLLGGVLTLRREVRKLHTRVWRLERGERAAPVDFVYAAPDDRPRPPERTLEPIARAELEAQIQGRLRAGRKIEAVKLWRAATGDGLEASVAAVERIGKGEGGGPRPA